MVLGHPAAIHHRAILGNEGNRAQQAIAKIHIDDGIKVGTVGGFLHHFAQLPDDNRSSYSLRIFGRRDHGLDVFVDIELGQMAFVAKDFRDGQHAPQRRLGVGCWEQRKVLGEVLGNQIKMITFETLLIHVSPEGRCRIAATLCHLSAKSQTQ